LGFSRNVRLEITAKSLVVRGQTTEHSTENRSNTIFVLVCGLVVASSRARTDWNWLEPPVSCSSQPGGFRLPRRRTLSEALELVRGEAELAEDLVEEGRPDLSAAMDWNRHGPAIKVVPPLVTSGLSMPDEAELTAHSLELPRGGS
jgi:hypothetical protein